MLDAPPVDDHGAAGDPGRWLDWGGYGPELHFAHANGFPPGTYRKLVSILLDEYHVLSMSARPLWKPEPLVAIDDWTELADDMRRGLEEQGLYGVPAVGHSLGAVCSLLASAEDPGLFSAIVAIDPLVLTGAKAKVWAGAKKIGQANKLGLVRGALRRRENWPDRDTARRAYSLKGAFRAWDPEVFDDYVEAGFNEEDDGSLNLRYPREWEARIFEVSPHDLWPKLRQVKIPVLFIQGDESDTFVNAARRRVVREMQKARVAVVPATTHFVPMEKPIEVARLIRAFLNESQGGGV